MLDLTTIGTTDWLVIAAGLATIAWVNWYFFFAERGAATAATSAGGVQEVTVAVHGGYSPATARVRRLKRSVIGVTS